jgi:hypothetical protein
LEEAIAYCNKLNIQHGYLPVYDRDFNHLNERRQITKDLSVVRGFRLPNKNEYEFFSEKTLSAVSIQDKQARQLFLEYKQSNNQTKFYNWESVISFGNHEWYFNGSEFSTTKDLHVFKNHKFEIAFSKGQSLKAIEQVTSENDLQINDLIDLAAFRLVFNP